MFKTKQEVDRHVKNHLKLSNDETERNLRCFSYAKLYFKVGDYDHTIRYINSYLSVKPKSSEAHNLLGKALEKQGKKQAALEAYKTSLKLDPKQNNLVFKLCELMAQDDIDVDNSGARYFCDLAQSLDPQNPIVSNLKEKLISNEGKNPTELAQFLLKELESRPTDVNLRVRLLKHFLENNMIKEAYKHAFDIEQKHLGIFDYNLAWYETFAEVLVRYQKDVVDTQLTWEFWFLSAAVLEKLAALSLSDHPDNNKRTPDYVLAVFNFDQSLLKASQSANACPDKALLKEFNNHYEAQLNLHLSVLAFKQAKIGLMKFKEVQNIILPILFTAYNVAVPDLQSVWFNKLAENRRLMVVGWHKEASFRCSQAGNILLGLSKDRRNILMEKANQYSTGAWREQLFRKLFVKRDQQLKGSTSYFVSSNLEPVIQLPDYRDIIKYNEVAQTVNVSSLHHYIWLASNYQSLSDFTLKSFDGLPYSVKNLYPCGAETLSILDVQSFIFCSTLCSQSKLKNADNSLSYFHQDRPPVMPVSITNTLGTVNQSNFLLAAYKMYCHEYTMSMTDARLILIRGIEVVRCVGNHGLDVKLLVDLATIYAEKMNNLTRQSEIDANAARAELYWRTALPMLEKLKNEHALIYPSNRLFEYVSNRELTQEEIARYIEKAKLFMGLQHMRKKEYEKAMNVLEGLKDPYASFYQSQIYKQMADTKTSYNRENVTSEMRSQNIILLSRARDCLYLTLDRLREPLQNKDHPLNSQLGTEIEKIERLLSRIDPDCTNRNECDELSDENAFEEDSTAEHYLSTYTHHTSFQNGRDVSAKNESLQMHSTPLRSVHRQEARPSPERLDAQLRQLMASRDVAMNSVLEQGKLMTELQRSLTEEIRGFKETVKHLTAAVDDRSQIFTNDFKDAKKMVDDLSHTVADFTHSVDDRLRSITDMVQDMRRELNDIKKDQQTKTSKISIEDLYDLGKDTDLNSGLDFNLSSNLGSAQPSLNPIMQSLYPNYHRLPQAPVPQVPNLAAYGGQGLYSSLYPGLSYPYLGLAQPGGLPYLPQVHPPPTDQQAALSQLHLPNNIPGFNPSVAPPAPPAPSENLRPLISQATAKEQTHAAPTGFNLGQVGFGTTPSAQSLSQQMKPSPSPAGSIVPISFAPSPISLGPTGFLGQSLSISSPVASSGGPNVPPSRAPPVNVVITSSDPLPTFTTATSQPILSVTIPPQHIKGNLQRPVPATSSTCQPHNYQIPLPTTTVAATAPSLFSQPIPVISTQSLLSNVPSPVISAIAPTQQTPDKNVSLGLTIEKVLNETFNNQDTSLNKSNVSTASVEYDPRPDFQAIIPLPDEVPVTTGEEKETELFCQRAKLFRHINKEWKERGIGNLKILYNPETGKVRLLMRREQVHKVCANHFLTKDIVLNPMPNKDRAYIWAAHDFADEEITLETFCARFSTAEDAKKFADAFNSAKAKVESRKSPPSTPKSESVTPITSLGGFKFITSPAFKPKEDPKPASDVVEEVVKPAGQPSPFASFSFGVKSTDTPAVKNLFESLSEPPTFSPAVASSNNNSTAKDDEEDDFVPTADFKPVLDKLPDLVEVKTGEENAEILFEARSKLFCWNTSGEKPEWKERGLGNIKVLKEDNKGRLVMRREQVHKVCLNHQILKSATFKKNDNDAKAVIWSAQDYSEGVLKSEMFTARFKNAEIANRFLKTVQGLQTSLDENNQISNCSKHHKPEATPKISFGDKFKIAKGSWECKNCYVVNEGKSSHCVACDTLKTGSTQKKEEPTFAFSAKETDNATEVTITPIGWGDQFKPAAGSWTCEVCYVNNGLDQTKCVSCETPKDGATPTTNTEKSTPIKGISLDTGGLTFNFGVPPSTVSKPDEAPKQEQPIQKFSFSVPTPKTEANSILSGFGDSFKPKPGTWECKVCYIRNEPSSQYCLSCETPKDDSMDKKEATGLQGINLETPGMKFNFGMPSNTITGLGSGFAFGDTSATNKPMVSKPEEQKVSESEEKPSGNKFAFGSPVRHDFDFKPRSPRKISTGQGDESDASYVEEEEINVHFKPVVPLPDIVEVKTGEENEEVLYSHRSKLYRFTAGEWKERGLGDIKILKDMTSGKLRVVMRREQVLKICLNHWLTKDIDYKPKDEKSWLFHVADFSEGELSRNQFCIRFKNAEVAQDFKKVIDDALGGAATVDPLTNETTEPIVEEPDDDDDVQFVSETQVTAEEEQEALRLGLPPKFFAYRQRPDCTCDQCKKDDEYLKDLLVEDSTPSKSVPDTPLLGTPPHSTSSKLIPTSNSDSFIGTPSDVPSEDSTINIANSLFDTPSSEDPAPPKLTSTSITGISFLSTPSNMPIKDPVVSKSHSDASSDLSSDDSTPNEPISDVNNGAALFGTPLDKDTAPPKVTSTSNTGASLFGTPSDLFKDSTQAKPSTTSTSSFGSSLFGTPSAISVAGTPSSIGSVFGSPATSFSVSSPANSKPDESNGETLRDLLQKPSLTPKSESTFTPKPKFTKSKLQFTTPRSADPVISPPGTEEEEEKETTWSLSGITPTNQDSSRFLFGGSKEVQSSQNASIFGTTPASNTTTAASNLFTGSIFSTPTGQFSSWKKDGKPFSSPANIFSVPKETSSGNISSAPKETSSDNIFCLSSTDIPNPAIFSVPRETSNIFGPAFSTTTTSASLVFGTKPHFASGGSIFGNSSLSSQQSDNIFGGGVLGTNSNVSTTSILTTANQTTTTTTNSSIFGSAFGQRNVFTQPIVSGQTLFGNKIEPKVTDANLSFGSTASTANLKESDEVVLKSDSSLSFANLAAQAGPKLEPTFAVGSQKDNQKSPFAFLGAGAPVFGNIPTKLESASPGANQLNKTREGSDNEEGEGTDHDPHFEPIVPLPDQIVVSTGEEEETVLFNERAKLFRFDSDNKEWKERGIGQFKILFHPENQTYRLLLRREQVHKVVLNQRIIPDLELQPMTTTDKAWIWVGMNYCEDEAKLEKLAVRFKNQAMAEAFKKCIDEVIIKVAKIQANKSVSGDSLPTTLADVGIENVSDDEDDDGDEDEDEDEDEDDDSRSIMFSKRCTLSEQTPQGWQAICMGDIQVYYDAELFAARILVITDDKRMASHSVIGINTTMEVVGNECLWTTVEWANEPTRRRTLKATFSSSAAAQELHSNYLEGLSYASEIGLLDAFPKEQEAE